MVGYRYKPIKFFGGIFVYIFNQLLTINNFIGRLVERTLAKPQSFSRLSDAKTELEFAKAFFFA
jgi:hypothetical protein